MRLVFHVTAVIFLFCLLLLGKLMVESREVWAQALAHIPVSDALICKFFLYSGRIFMGVAVVWGLLEVVAVMILTNGWVIDLLVGSLI